MNEQELISLWKERYEEGYFDEAGHLRLHFVQRAAIEPLAKAMANGSPKLTRHQIRRFFQHGRAVERRLKTDTESCWAAVAPDIVTLDKAAADAFSKKDRKIPLLFHDFVKNNIAVIQNAQQFREGFMRHFESIVAFGQQYFEEQTRH